MESAHDGTLIDHLLHELAVDRQPAGRVDDEDVAPEATRFNDARARGLHGVSAPLAKHIVGFREHRHVDLASKCAQLLDRGRALEVGAD